MPKTSVNDYDNTAANNTDIDSVNIAENCAPSGINNAIRELMAHIADLVDGTVTATKADGFIGHAFSDLASAATTDLSTISGWKVNITGTTTITSFGTAAAGMTKLVKFAGALTLTHNGTSLILPGAASVTTAAGDCLIAVSEGSGNWRVVVYQRANSTSGAVPSQSVITASETYNVPTGATRLLIELVGGGGGGGGGDSGSSGSVGPGGGGGAGGYVRELYTPAASTLSVTIGSGGAGGVGESAGSNGGDTTITDGVSLTLTAGGGSGGGTVASATTVAVAAGGSGGTASGGDLNSPGGGGGAGIGVNPGSAARAIGGVGGGSFYGGGGGGGGSGSGADGGAASAYGAGGGGAGAVGTTARTGGDGADGVVVITAFF